MHHMSELMEKGHHIIMVEQRRLFLSWLIEITNHRCNRRRNLPLNFSSFDHREDGCMVELVISWVHVKIEMAE